MTQRERERANKKMRQSECSRVRKGRECHLAFPYTFASTCLDCFRQKTLSTSRTAAPVQVKKRRKQQWLRVYIYVCACVRLLLLHLISSRLVIRRIALHGSLSSSTVFPSWRGGGEERGEEERKGRRKKVVVQRISFAQLKVRQVFLRK